MGNGVLTEIAASALMKARETANPFRKRRAGVWETTTSLGIFAIPA
jgi:hypothetical protein